MTEEKFEDAYILRERVQKYTRVVIDLNEMPNFGGETIIKVKNYSPEIIVPDELIQPIYDMILKHYDRLRDKAQMEFDAL